LKQGKREKKRGGERLSQRTETGRRAINHLSSLEQKKGKEEIGEGGTCGKGGQLILGIALARDRGKGSWNAFTFAGR